LRKFLAERPGDYRILMTLGENTAMSLGALDMWGYDAVVPRRYAQFMAFTQGLNPDAATKDLLFTRLDPLFAMLRWRYAFEYDKDGNLKGSQPNDPPMGRLQLIRTYRVLTNRDEIFAAMAAPSFDPRKEVILETAPNPPPAFAGEKNEVKLLASSTDSLIIEANLPSPAILLITDNYSESWRARPLGETAQASYEVLPANYCLRAIPLAAGHHKIQVEYLPTGFVIGKWISLVTAVIYLGLLGWQVRKRQRNG
jgi:hypothetical protein